MNSITKLSPYVILSYPRSGSHYLQNLLMARLGIYAERQHKMENIKKKDVCIISVVRNPADAMSSDVAKEVYHGLKWVPLDLENSEDLSQHIDVSIAGFLESMMEILDNSNIIIKFDDLVSNPDKIAEKISNILKIRTFNNYQDISVGSEPQLGKNPFIPSSKDLTPYEMVSEIISQVDLSLATNAYKKVIARSI